MLRVLLLPVMIVILGGFVAFMVVAMFLPLVTLVNAVSSGS
jgi:type II secretory pathway component PulF